MSILFKEAVKYKLLSFEELVINLDRLSRFKLPEISYNRVFSSIILKHLISPVFSSQEIEKLSAEYISEIVRKIWNDSVKNLTAEKIQYNCLSEKSLKLLVNSTFKNTDKRTKTFINTKLIISPVLEKLDYSKSAQNLKLLIKINEIYKNKHLTKEKLFQLRNKYALKFPISKLIIVEGITEEILLPVFASKLHHDFNKEGIFVLGAGGKSKSPSVYVELKDKLKIPVSILFDSDAKEVYKSLDKILLKKDKAVIIQSGEFEDILSCSLIKRALNREYNPADPILAKDLHIHKSMCENIENFYKTRHLGEFKKSKLSKILAQNVKYSTDITNEIREIIMKII